MARRERHDVLLGRTPLYARSHTAPAIRGAIVGVGASAGGLDAFKRFFSTMPARSGVAFVLIPHLDPNHPSYMVELLTRHTPLRVLEAKEGMTVEPDSVYIIPPNQYLAIRERGLHLSEPPVTRHASTAIDPFFKSLANDQGEKAVGIILSGTGSYGTQGLREIKLAGGMVMAQSPESADYDQMPRNAVATGLVDYVLPPEEMPAALLRYARHPYLIGSTADSPETIETLARILAVVKSIARLDLRCYRKSILLRRIHRRMGLHHVEEYSSYLQLLRDSPDEVNALCADLLVKRTGFFREPRAFDALSRKVIAQLAARATAETPARIWVPGCATGEEAYSIAILLLEAFHALDKKPNMQLFATDLSRSSIQLARQGIYSQSVVSNIGRERLERFFVRLDEDHYQVTKPLRESCIFAIQNVTADAPFSRLDLVSCRNVLPYLDEMQSKLIRLFHFALKPRGYLFLGSMEGVGRRVARFEPVSRMRGLYRRAGRVRREKIVRAFPPAERPPVEPRNPIQLMERQLLAHHTPAAVIVDASFRTLGYHGPIVNYLEFPAGQPTRDLLAMSRPGLRSRLRAAIQHAARENAKVEAFDCQIKRDGRFIHCVVTVSPLDERQQPRLYLVTFRGAAEGLGLAPEAGHFEESALVKHLEDDLKATREDLQSTIEELESTVDEVKTSNEEVLSLNEELQSANEELETSKEELRAINDELSTVNSQLRDKVVQLEHLHDDLISFMNSTEIAVLFLDLDGKIKRFSPAAIRLLNLLDSDLGRPLRHLRFDDQTLLEDVEQAIDRQVPAEKDVHTRDGRFYLRRVLPYCAADLRMAGVVVTLVEITARKRAEAALAELNAALERRVQERTGALETAQAELARSHESLRSLWARLLSAEDLERRRISRELHDDFSQRLAMLSVDIESLKVAESSNERISGRLQKMAETAAVLSEDVRQLAYSLHPSILDHLGLSSALRRYADEFSALHDISVTFLERGIDGKIDSAVASCLYRVAQEALTNVARHSRSPRATIHLLATPRAFRLSVMDIGDGFDLLEARRGIKTLGLVSMEERVRFLGGEFRIRSSPGMGTILRATCPRGSPPEITNEVT